MIHTGINMDYPPEIHQFVMENGPKKTFDDLPTEHRLDRPEQTVKLPKGNPYWSHLLITAWWCQPLWKMMDNSSVGMTFHSQLFLESHSPVMFQTTNQIIIYYHHKHVYY